VNDPYAERFIESAMNKAHEEGYHEGFIRGALSLAAAVGVGYGTIALIVWLTEHVTLVIS
jgi:hypothetical protein